MVPVGAFLVIHLWTYSSALGGRHAFDQSVGLASHGPYRWLIDAVLVWLPLSFHAVYGMVLTFQARPNVKSYAYARNWGYLLQRLTGVVVLAFIGFHAYQFPIQVALGHLEPDEFFVELCSSLSSTVWGGVPLVAVGYLVGIAATCYHFANGLTNFCFSWGVTTSRQASRRVAGVSGLLAIVLFALGASSVIYFATGSRLVLTFSPSYGAAPVISCQDLQKSSQTSRGSRALALEQLASVQPSVAAAKETQ